MHCTEISAEFECGVIATRLRTPKNVAVGYDVGKISAGCLVLQYGIFKNTIWLTGVKCRIDLFVTVIMRDAAALQRLLLAHNSLHFCELFKLCSSSYF